MVSQKPEQYRKNDSKNPKTDYSSLYRYENSNRHRGYSTERNDAFAAGKETEKLSNIQPIIPPDSLNSPVNSTSASKSETMTTIPEQKSSVDEIRQRFDNDVDRFSNIETGQTATIDAPLAMELITQAAVNSTKRIHSVLDIGCGAGNNTIKLSNNVSPFDCDIVDLSLPMLKRAQERISEVNTGNIRLFQGDFRVIDLPEQAYDVILAAAVLHHLRDDQDWESTFSKIYRLTAPGGSVWITDLVSHETRPVQSLMWRRYGEYLCSVGGESYKDNVFDYIDKEDSPRPVTYQLGLLRKVGFNHVELLHKNSCFAAFGAIKTG